MKDRANTGKLLDSLEKRGYVTRTLSIKNNRPVKIVDINENDEIKIDPDDVLDILKEFYNEKKKKAKEKSKLYQSNKI